MLLIGQGDASATTDDSDTRHFLSTDFDAKEAASLLFERLRRAEPYASQEDSDVVTSDAIFDIKRNAVIENAREYQREIFRHAMQRNTICMLGTGLGKTFIAVMLVRELLALNRGKKAIILCPTAFLVEQQADVFCTNAPHAVGAYHGGRLGSDWTPERWEKEWSEMRVFVMTPQILVNLLNHAYVSLESVCAVVIDECHHVASGDHPMRQVMHRVREAKVNPRVLGLTASPVVTKPKNLTLAIAELEKEMCDARLMTADVGDALKPPKEEVVDFAHHDLKSLPGPPEVLEILPGGRENSDVMHLRRKVIRMLNLWRSVSAGAARRFVVAQCNAPWGGELRAQFRDALKRLKVEGFEDITREGEDVSVKDDYISPKFAKLINILKTSVEPGQDQVVIFVEMRDVAFQMAAEIQTRTELKCEWLIGITSKMDIREGPNLMLHRFRKFKSGYIDVLVATAAAEEGIDVPGVSVVISYDGVKQVKSYVQMRGRCRFSLSRYIIFNTGAAERVRYEQATKVEEDMFEWISNRPSDLELAEAFLEEPGPELPSSLYPYQDVYKVESSGALVDQRSAVSLLFQVAHSITAQDPVRIMYHSIAQMFVGVMELSNFLPPAIRKYISQARSSKKDCKRECCMMAIRRLHAQGWMTDRLLPISVAAIMGLDEENPEQRHEVLAVLAAAKAARLEKIQSRAGGQEALVEEDVTEKPVAEQAGDGGTLAAEMAKEIRDDSNEDQVVLRLWRASTHVFLVQMGDLMTVKLRLPLELSVGDVFCVAHPVVGAVDAKILEILGDEQPTQDERAFNDLIWTYLDPDETDKSRNFFLTVVDSEQRRRMLEAAQKMEQGPDEGEALVDVDFLLESRTQKHKLYACMGLSEMTPQSPFPDLDKAATFEEYFATKYELFPPTETDRERPLIVGKVARSKFKPRHFCATSYRHKSQYREYVPHYAVKQFWMLRDVFFALECIPTFLRLARRRFAARRVCRSLLPEVTLTSDLLYNMELAITPTSAGYGMESLERLEFLGDSLLKVFTTRRLYREFPYHEGRLTDLRGAVVGNVRLSQIFMASDALNGAVDPRTVHYWKMQDQETATMKMKHSSDAVEAVFGAVYVACGRSLDFVLEIATRLGTFQHFPRPKTTPLDSEISEQARLWEPSLEIVELQERIGWKFANPLLLLEAMTHPTDSSSIVKNYNRLEFLGDALVDLAVVLYSLKCDDTMSPEVLSNWRYVCASTEGLGRVAKYWKLNRFLEHFDSQLARDLDAYCGSIDAPSVWLDKTPKVMADIFESVIGAVYVDCGYDTDTALKFCQELASPIWTRLTPNPDIEPTRLVRERLDHLVSLKWERQTQTLLCNNYVLASSGIHMVRNWLRINAWKACQMIDACPDLVDALMYRGSYQTKEQTPWVFNWLIRRYQIAERVGETVLTNGWHVVFCGDELVVEEPSQNPFSGKNSPPKAKEEEEN